MLKTILMWYFEHRSDRFYWGEPWNVVIPVSRNAQGLLPQATPVLGTLCPGVGHSAVYVELTSHLCTSGGGVGMG